MGSAPHPKDDPISRLYAQYFLQSDTLFRFHKKLEEERSRKGRVSRNKELDEFHLQKLWLASLWVLVEGFQTSPIQRTLERWKEMSLNIRVHCGSIEHKVTQLGDELRLFRNATFHFHANPEKHLKFIQVKSRHKKPHGVVRDDQPDAREGQAGRFGVTERFVVPLKPGNALGGRIASRV